MIDPTDDKIKLLHAAVSQKYDVGTLDEFKAKLQDPAKRKAFYDGVGKEYDLGEYSDFENKVKKKDDTFAVSLPGQINLPEPSSDGLVTAPPSPSPEQQILTGQIPEPQSSGITIAPTKEQDKAFNEAINTKPLTFEEAGLDYEKKRKAEEKTKESMGDTYYEMYGKPEPQGVVQDFAKDLEQVPPAFNKGVFQAFTSIPKAVGILAQGLEKLTGWRDKPIEEYPTYQLGKVIEDKALELGLTATDPRHSNFFNSALPNAFGSMLGMMATGGAGIEAKAGIEAVPSAMGALKDAAPLMTTGAAQNAVPEFDAAKAAGMSDEEAFKVFLKNIPGGLTEAAPIIDAFGRLNKLTGNSILNVLKVGTANGLEEATQEGVQQWSTNLVAQGSYDPKRAQWDGLVESLGAAFVVGFVLPGVMTAMQSQPKAIADQVMADIHKALKNHEGSGKGVVGQTIENNIKAPEGDLGKQNEKPTEQGAKVSGQNIPEVKQEETVPVQAEQKKEETLKPKENEIGNNPQEVNETGRGRPLSAGGTENRTEGGTEQGVSGGDHGKRGKEEVREDKVLETKPSPEVEFLPKDNWDKNLMKAREYANHLEIDIKGKNLEQLVNEIHHAISQQSAAGLGTHSGGNESLGGTSESSGVGLSQQGSETSAENRTEEEKQPAPQVSDNIEEEVKFKADTYPKEHLTNYYPSIKGIEFNDKTHIVIIDKEHDDGIHKELHIQIQPDLQKKGIAAKLIKAFVNQNGSIEINKKSILNENINKVVDKIKDDPNFSVIDSNGVFTISTQSDKPTTKEIADENKGKVIIAKPSHGETPTQGSEVLRNEPEAKDKIDGESDELRGRDLEKAKSEANKIAEEHGFDSASHLLNSVLKRTGKEYATVQEVPKNVIKQVKEERESEPKKDDIVNFTAPTGQTKTGKIEGFDEDKGKYKIRASNGTVWNIDAKNINVYEGEQASTEKFYEPPIGSPKKAKGKTTRISVSPIYGVDPKMLKQILIDLSKSIASKIYYAKRIAGRRRALGTYSPSNAAIHIKFQGDLDTTAHELGHSIDDVFDLLGKSNPVMEKELMELSKFGSKPKKGTANPKAYKLGEGLAEYIRAWLVNPNETKSKYPETSKVFDSTIPKETIDKLRKFGDDIRGYAGLSGHNKIMSNVQFEPEKNENWFTTLLKNRSKENFELTWFDRLGQQWTNNLLPFEKAVKFLLDKQGITQVEPSKNPVILARLLAGENSKVQDILENGFIDSANPIDASKPNDVKLNRMIDPVSGEPMNFEWLITPLDNSTEQSIKEEQKKVISYLIAKRTVEMSTKLGREDFLTGIGAGLFQDIVVAKERLAEHDSDSKETKDRIEEAARRYQAFADAGLQYAVANGRLSKEDYKAIKDANLEYVALNRISEASPDEEAVSFKKTGSKALGSVSQIVHKLKGSTKTIQNPYQSLVENTINVIKESDRNNALLAFKELAVAARGMHQGEPVNLSSIVTQVGGSGDNTITIFDNGKKEYWKLDGDVYKAVKNITENIKLAGWLTALPRLLRWGIIHFPVFAVRNRIRDIGSRFVISKNAFSGLDINLKKGRKKATLEAYNNAGGGQAGYYLMGEDFYNEKIEEVTRELAKDKKNILTTPDKLLHNANNWYNNLIGSGETATRLEEYRSAFKQAKEKGLDDYNAMIHAAFKARDLLDFAVAGEQMKWINQIIPFSNASVQGLRKTINSAKEDPSGFAIRFMLYAVLPTLFMRMMAHAFDRDKEYAELPDYRRDLFYNIPVGENLWITIPKPFEIGVLSSGAERVFSKIFYGDKKALEGYAGSVARSTTPIDDAALAGPGRSGVEIMANYDFFRNEHIIPTEEEKMDLKLRNTESASRLGKVIGSLVASDPRYVDYLVKSNAGYFGDLAMRLSDIDRDHTRHPIDFTMTGLFRNDPVYDSKSVQHLMDEVKRLGIKNNDSFLRLFNLTLSDYFDQKDPKMKAEAGKNVRETAEFISKIWEGMKLEDIKFMEHDIKTSIRK